MSTTYGETVSSTAWPAGGTLGEKTASTVYGDSGIELGVTPAAAAWPPVFTTGSLPLGLYAIRQGGNTGSLDGLTRLDKVDVLIISAFKAGDGGALVASVRAANPAIKILCYKAASELITGTTTTRNSNTGIHYNEAVTYDATSGAGDKWILKDSGGNAIPNWYGYSYYYGGDIGLASFQTRWYNNVKDTIVGYGLDGVFVDNTLATYPNLFSGGPAPVKYATQAAWETAMAAFSGSSGAFTLLKNDGYLVYPNAHKYIDDGTDHSQGIKDWWTRIAPGVTGFFHEYWMEESSNLTITRRENPPSGAGAYRNYANLIPHAQALGKGFMGHTQSPQQAGNEYMGIYGRAAFLLKWDGLTGSYYGWSIGGSADDYSAQVNYSIGTPVGAEVEIQAATFRRYYTQGAVVLNAHASIGYTLTASPDGRAYTDYAGAAITYPVTVASGRAVVWRTTSAPSASGATYNDEVLAETALKAFHKMAGNANDSKGTAHGTAGAGVTFAAASLITGDTEAAATFSGAVNTARISLPSPGLSGASTFASEIFARTGLKHQWRLGEAAGSGTVTDAKVAASGTVGAGVTLGSSSLLTGDANTAASFNGTATAKITLADPAAGTAPWQVEFVANPTGVGSVGATGFGTMFGIGYGSRLLWEPSSGKLLAQFGGANVYSTANAVPAATTSLIGVGWTGTEIVLTVNGVEVGRGAATAASLTGTLYLGAYEATITNYAYSGKIDEFAVYTALIATSTLAADYTRMTAASSGSWAVETWVKDNGPGAVGDTAYGTVFGVDFARRLLLDPLNNFLLAQFSGASIQTAVGSVASAVRHHLVVEYEASVNLVKVYIDAVLKGSSTPTSTPKLDAAVYVGAYESTITNYAYKGDQQKFAIYSSALGITRIQSHYQNGTT